MRIVCCLLCVGRSVFLGVCYSLRGGGSCLLFVVCGWLLRVD